MRQLAILLIAILLVGCAAKKDYQSTLAARNLNACNTFLLKHGKSKYALEVLALKDRLQDDEDWRKAGTRASSAGYAEYLILHPSGQYATEARRLKAQAEEREAYYAAMVRKDKDLLRSFLDRYPNSLYADQARSALSEAEESEAWKQAMDLGTASSFERYLQRYPQGAHASEARSRMEKAKVKDAAWQAVKRANSQQAYERFLKDYPDSQEAKEAQRWLLEHEDSIWEKARNSSLIKDCQAYLDVYPQGRYATEAHKRLIDLEVERVFKGDHGVLPPMERGGAIGYSAESSVTIENNTSYTLHVLFSGKESKRVVLKAKRKDSVSFPNGSYKIAAWVDAPHVTPYAGTDLLTGGEYSSVFYIETKFR